MSNIFANKFIRLPKLLFKAYKTNASIKMTSKSGQAIEKLREFGYAFNENGELKQIEKSTGVITEKPFEFDVFKDQVKNQAHYEKLADQIPEIVYDLLEKEGLSRMYLPVDIPEDHATFIFTAPPKLQKPKKLLILIHGSGYVRAGQWARSLIINNSIDHGTQIPYIKKGQSLGYDILVMNTNDNYRNVNGSRKLIPKMGSAIDHAVYVWENVVMASEPETVAIVAHSYGGAVTIELAQRYPEFFKEKIFGVAFTDSAHYGISETAKNALSDKTWNWISSNSPLDTEFKKTSDGIITVSAGHPKHEWSSYAAFESVFKVLEKQYETFPKPT